MRRSIQTKYFLAVSAAMVALLVGLPGSARASTIISEGWDLFTTVSADFDFGGALGLNVVDFEGDPFGTFDFGSGPLGVGLTDTIVRRLEAADLTIDIECGLDCDTIDIEIVALSLISVSVFDIGNGFENILIGFDSDLGSTMSITDTTNGAEGDPHGTFDSTLNFVFSVSGSISGFLTTLQIGPGFSAANVPWSHTNNDPNAKKIVGVNFLLDGTTDTDFFPVGDVCHNPPSGCPHIVESAVVPEPGTGLLIGAGLMGIALAGRRKRGV